jgi:phage gpG-like protein
MPDATAELDRLIAGLDGAVSEGLDGAAVYVAGVARRGTKGNLAASITVRRTGANERTIGTDLFYAAFVENGRPAIDAAPGKFLRFESGGRIIFAKHVAAAPAQRFMAHAADAADQHAAKFIEAAINRLIKA